MDNILLICYKSGGTTCHATDCDTARLKTANQVEWAKLYTSYGKLLDEWYAVEVTIRENNKTGKIDVTADGHTKSYTDWSAAYASKRKLREFGLEFWKKMRRGPRPKKKPQ